MGSYIEHNLISTFETT